MSDDEQSSPDSEADDKEEIMFSPGDLPESKEYKIRANVDQTEDEDDNEEG